MRSKFTFNHFTLLSALFISSVAIWYSVAGLATIFAASKIAVIIMGTALEVGKLVAAVWLHRNWHEATRWLKTYLSIAVVVLMLITSMGIFGYLSKSHVEQTAASEESVAQVQRIDNEIARHKAIITRAEEKIKKYEQGGSGADTAINAQIDKEQSRIDTAYKRVEPLIQVQRDIIAAENKKLETRIKPYQDEIDQINADLKAVEDALQAGQIKKAQRLIGANDDGDYGEKTIIALKEYRAKKEKRRKWLMWKIDDIKSKPSQATLNAQAEIKRINESVKADIDQSQQTIKQLRARLGKQSDGDVESLIAAENKKIKESNVELDRLTQDKYSLQAQKRKLEAEVGPIKYIAEFIYGTEADANLLEKAVKWVIILIIFVFDPLAVLLLIATQYSFERAREQRKQAEALDKIDDIVHKTEEVLHEAETVEHNLEDLLKDYPKPKPDEKVDVWDLPAEEVYKEPVASVELDEQGNVVAAEGVDEAFIDSVKELQEELAKVDAEEADEPKIEEVHEEPWEDLNELNEIARELKRRAVYSLTKVGENYVNFNGKVFRIKALVDMFPELGFDFESEVKSGTEYPVATEKKKGMLFLRVDQEPTNLYICNGKGWDKIDKNVLEYSAYSHEYVKALIKRVGNGEYNPELLNELERKHIENLLT